MRTTLPELTRLHAEHVPIAMLTCYDASFAGLLDTSGVDALLVGDSLGMVVQGHSSPNPVSLADMAYHTAAVVRGSQRSFVLADLPFGTSQISPQDTCRNAVVLIQAGAQMVKIEGGSEMAATVEFLVRRGIPVCAHIGMTPQSHNQFGGFRVQGREPAAADRLVQAARDLESAGAGMVLMECVPQGLAERICELLAVPTIGIGASPRCSGQVLVLYDVIGLGPVPLPRLAEDFSVAAPGLRGSVTAYVEAVKARRFPQQRHCY
jgi:3-methyl-2-oxobutanoate hydroxymethyltransferase